MASYLLISQNQDWLKDQTLTISSGSGRVGLSAVLRPALPARKASLSDAGRQAGEWETFVTSPDTLLYTDKKITIREVREIITASANKPFQEPGIKVIIGQLEESRVEAQQALLKILEEPPESATLIIWAKTKEQLLPTIRSRCFIIEDLATTERILKNREKTLMADLLTSSIGVRLQKAREIGTDKESVTTFIENLLLYYTAGNERTRDYKGPDARSVSKMRFLLQILDHLQKNTSPKMALDMVLIKLGDR